MKLTPVSCFRDYAETPIAPAPHPRRTRSGTGRGTDRDQRFSQAFREGAASSGNARSGSPRLALSYETTPSQRMGRPTPLRQATAERGGSRGATAGTDRAGCGPIVEVPRCFLSTLKAGFFSPAQTDLETALLAGRPHRGMECRQRLWMSITGSSSIRRLNDCPVESGPERARPSRRVARGREARAAARDRPAGPRSHTARVRRRRERPAAWSSARAPSRSCGGRSERSA